MCKKWLVQAGLTLIELLLSLSLLAAVFCCCLPFTSSLFKKNKVQLIADELKGAIQYSKIQALSTGDSLVLTPLPGANGWSGGMLLFVGNGKYKYSPDMRVLHEWHWKVVGVEVTWRGFQSQHYLLFAPDIHSSAVNGTFVIKNDKQQIALVVNRLGRVKETV